MYSRGVGHKNFDVEKLIEKSSDIIIEGLLWIKLPCVDNVVIKEEKQRKIKMIEIKKVIEVVRKKLLFMLKITS